MKHTYIRKSIAMLIIFALISTLTFSPAGAAPDTIYETSTIQTITSGATLENIVRYTTDGWLNIHVLRVDLFNPNIQVDSMSNGSSIQKLSSTKALAEARGAIAAVNTSFFSFSAQSGIGYPSGTAFESGKLTSASSDSNKWGNDLATLSISKLNQTMFDYWKTDITLVAPNGTTIPAARYNKNYSANTDLTILDSRWSDQTIGVSQKAPDLVEMLVVDGKVSEIRQAQPAAPMPANGYVVVTRQAGGQTLSNNFQVGDPVSLSIKTTPDWNSLKAAFTGGAMLIRDGQIPQTFSHIPEGTRSTRNPRTAAGSTKDGKQLIVVTVDGRQNSSIGMTLGELAQFMLDIGAYNALNFDGGGSTTMVARNPRTQALEVMNSPSDGAARRVTSALGVFSVAPPSSLDGLMINAPESNVFVNTSRTFSVQGFDRYYNAIPVDPDKVKWSVSGIQGEFKGSTFYPKSVGPGVIKATFGTKSATFEVTSLSSPVQLKLNTSIMNLSINATGSFNVLGKNKNGYYAGIDPQDVKWTVTGKIGSMSNNIFTASLGGTGYIDAAVGSTHAYCAVTVDAENTKSADAFEADNGTYIPYPANVEGSYSISNEQKHSGQSSGKLSYNFALGEGSRAAYFVYPGDGLKLDGNTKKISLWVYNTHENPNWLGLWIYDASGEKQMVYLTKNMDWVGWKQLEANISGINTPQTLSRIYLVQPNPVTDEGSIYLDDLSVTTATRPALDLTKLPKDTVPADDARKAVTISNNSTSTRFSIYGQGSKLPAKPDKSLMIKLPGAASAGHQAFDNKISQFIQLDMSKQGLRLSDPNQWKWFLNQLNSTGENSIFILLAGSPDRFKDPLESDLLMNVLSDYRQKTGKTIWVIYNGVKNDSTMEKGVKYISTTNTQWIQVTVKGSDVTYEFKPVK